MTTAEHLVLHAGLHKTGTTSIQNALKNSGRRFSWGPTRSPLTVDLLEAAFRQGKVISSEALFGWLTPTSLYDAAQSNLAVIAAARVPVHLIVSFREPMDWYRAIYSQFVAEGAAFSVDEFLAGLASSPYFRLSTLIHDIRSALPEAKLSLLAYSSDACGDFSAVTGIRLSCQKRRNVSMSPARTHLAARLNTTQWDVDVRKLLQSRVPPIASPPRSLFTPCQMAQLEPAVADWRQNVLPQLTAPSLPPRFETAEVEDAEPATCGDILEEALAVIDHLLTEASFDADGARWESGRRTEPVADSGIRSAMRHLYRRLRDRS